MRYVIIGNSAAAVGCIEGIRKNDKTGGITVIGEENPSRIRATAHFLSS